MSLAILALGTVFVWVTGLFYLRHVREFLRMRTDRITFELFPFARSAELQSGGFWHTILRAVHGISAILYVVIGVPIMLFFMGLLPFMLVRQLMQG